MRCVLRRRKRGAWNNGLRFVFIDAEGPSAEERPSEEDGAEDDEGDDDGAEDEEARAEDGGGLGRASAWTFGATNPMVGQPTAGQAGQASVADGAATPATAAVPPATAAASTSALEAAPEAAPRPGPSLGLFQRARGLRCDPFSYSYVFYASLTPSRPSRRRPSHVFLSRAPLTHKRVLL